MNDTRTFEPLLNALNRSSTVLSRGMEVLMTTAKEWLPWLLLVGFFITVTLWARTDHARELEAKDATIEALILRNESLEALIRERLVPFDVITLEP